ncbi:hypothetical protein [Asticcacaulis sp. YBE204]|uniref:hypothetical protein n=1 Tax=Asticcacaulis sp. YBE204 TaxID=1282363 RepID=UPI0003C3D91F|nr:hypothetical protein [Asticcacaulis sp. YBE204]ESQ78477.1 hypothetical protein AEYBE204_13055 [Asticcacaulis sp. YBE204]
MVAYNFKARFVPLIEARTKTQTIRNARRRNSRVGDSLQFFHGSRFKPIRLGAAQCVDSGPVHLFFDDAWIKLRLSGGTRIISSVEGLDAFAVADGFGDWADLRQFWRETHGDWSRFEGWITMWGETFVPVVPHV